MKPVHPFVAVAALVVGMFLGATFDSGIAPSNQDGNDSGKTTAEEAPTDTTIDVDKTPEGPAGRVENPSEEYKALVEFALADIEAYWSRTYPSVYGDEYEPIKLHIPYSTADDGPSCGGVAALPNNAFYCSDGDFIAWDEKGLLAPFYERMGDAAVAFVIAHEWGHAIQARRGFKFEAGIKAELQSDCYAGAWSGDANRRGLLEPGDLDEVIVGLLAVRDKVGTNWLEPGAHGSGFDRTASFQFGFENGAAACTQYAANAKTAGALGGGATVPTG